MSNLPDKLMYCPDCGQEISKRAKVCPHCGRPIAEEPKKVEQHEQNQTQNNGSNAFGVFIAVLLAIIFAVWIIPQLFRFEMTFELIPGK